MSKIRWKIFVLMILGLFILTGCTKNEENVYVEKSIVELENDDELSMIEIVMPMGFFENSTQEELDKIAKEKKYESITLNEDRSATYKMKKSIYNEKIKEIENVINDELLVIAGSEEYPNIVGIEAKNSFSEFVVKVANGKINEEEKGIVYQFSLYGNIYNLWKGKEIDNINVKFVDEKSEEKMYEFNSKDRNSLIYNE